jgi:hypothetical protein
MATRRGVEDGNGDDGRGDVVDVAMIEELERVLTTTRFVTADELVARGGPVMPTPPPATTSMTVTEPLGERPPLPRRPRGTDHA